MFFEMKFAKFKTTADFRAATHQTLDYIASRVNREGEKMERLLFGWDIYEKAEAEQFIDSVQPKPLRFWRMILSPDPNSEQENLKRDLDLWDLTRKVMSYIRDTIDPTIEFIVAEHNDHTDIPHVQGLVFFKGRLTKRDLNRMRQIAIAQALAQRRVRDLTHKQQRTQLWRQKDTAMRSSSVERGSDMLRSTDHVSHPVLRVGRQVGMAGGRARRLRGMKPMRERIGCENCSYKNAMVKLKDGKYWCPTCGKVREREYELAL
jgi:hypothetical protein